MRIVWALMVGHVLALAFGVGGLLIALPRPDLWAANPIGVGVFTFGMRYSGVIQIVLGAATMLAFGLRWLGWRNALLFLALSTSLSLGIELLGTGTGWPFGAYEYTAGLGEKILDRVPYTIPLSWFSMGLSSLLLASAITTTLRLQPRPVWSVGLGVWLLTVWDLVLDPAMAHESLPVRFWVWHDTGPYFGMPIQNFVGWSATGLLFMALSRALWRAEPRLPGAAVWLPFSFYLANMIFAMALSLSVGLWQPVIVALVLGLVPSLLALVPPTARPGRLTVARGTQ